VKPTLLLLAGLALSFSAGPAHALKHLGGCDIVVFVAKGSPVSVSPELWLDYREATEAALASSGSDPRALSAGVIQAQQEFLAALDGSAAYQDSLAGNSCRLLSKLNASAVDALLAEAVHAAPGPVAEALAQIIQAARTQIDNIEWSARFRSNRDKTLFAAQYYCFIAAAIVAFLPPERRESMTLEDFGDTVSCKDAGRTS
jgi:hypothetical protein